MRGALIIQRGSYASVSAAPKMPLKCPSNAPRYQVRHAAFAHCGLAGAPNSRTRLGDFMHRIFPGAFVLARSRDHSCLWPHGLSRCFSKEWRNNAAARQACRKQRAALTFGQRLSSANFHQISQATQRICVTRLRPASVFPAPGTPVTKQITFWPFVLALSIISVMR